MENLQIEAMVNEGGFVPPIEEKEENNVQEFNDVGNEAAMKLLATLQEKIDELKALEAKLAPTEKSSTKKNHRPGKPTSGRKYVLLADKLSMWGKVPQQQLDLAAILMSCMEVGKEYTEDEVFDFLVDNAGSFKSIYSSNQDPTYLFRYYRGLKNDGKHAGFIARNFIRQIN